MISRYCANVNTLLYILKTRLHKRVFNNYRKSLFLVVVFVCVILCLITKALLLGKYSLVCSDISALIDIRQLEMATIGCTAGYAGETNISSASYAWLSSYILCSFSTSSF